MTPEEQDMVENVKTLPDRVAAVVAGLSQQELRWRPAEGEWSIKEVCGHLCDDSEMWRRRLALILSEDNPTLPTYEQEELVRERAYQDADLAAVLADFRRNRQEIATLLSSLAPRDWERAGVHPEHGPRTIRTGMELMITHTEGHLDQLRELKKQAKAE
jgi:uncharacterized damage-inducible protein DinB